MISYSFIVGSTLQCTSRKPGQILCVCVFYMHNKISEVSWPGAQPDVFMLTVQAFPEQVPCNLLETNQAKEHSVAAPRILSLSQGWAEQ